MATSRRFSGSRSLTLHQDCPTSKEAYRSESQIKQLPRKKNEAYCSERQIKQLPRKKNEAYRSERRIKQLPGKNKDALVRGERSLITL